MTPRAWLATPLRGIDGWLTAVRRGVWRCFARVCWLGLLLGHGAVRGEVKLPALFSDHMVLQQGRAVPVWGWAEEGEEIVVEFRGQRVQAKTGGGRWQITLAPLRAGGPDRLVVTGKNQRVVEDVLVGEVWVCSGQSNMEWPVARTFAAEEAMAAANHPRLRLFTVPWLKANEPVADVPSAWRECTSQTVSNFSAVAYFFGRDLHKALGVPVGLVHASWGGSPVEVWIREGALQADPRFVEPVLGNHRKAMERYATALSEYEEEVAALAKEGKQAARSKPGLPWKPGELYAGMIAPLIPYAIQGAIWYQGEANAGRANQYRSLLPALIQHWRADWGQGSFPFLQVQLAPWDRNKARSLEDITRMPGESNWAELREAQWMATRTLPGVGMAVITDLGEKDDIHPVKKEPVGARLALTARGQVYGESIPYLGPSYRGMQVVGGKVRVGFEHVGTGLESLGGPLTGFALAGPDRKFVWAEAMIEGSEVVVSTEAVKEPVAVRYGWADFPVVNLYNREGFPAVPFRSDDFPMVSAGQP